MISVGNEGKKDMKKRIGIAAGIVIVLALLAAGVFMYLNSAINSKLTEGKIMDGVECDGVDLGGMTKAEAEKALEKHISGLHKGNMTFTVDDKKVEVSLETLGAAPNAKKTAQEAYDIGRTGSIFKKYSDVNKEKHEVAVYRTYDESIFKKQMKKATADIITAPENASVKRENGEFTVTKEKSGYTLNVDDSFDKFKEAVDAGRTKCELVVTKKKAEYTTKDVEKIKDVMGTYTTNYSSSAYGRKVNVANGAKKINGTVIYPGETFSVYKQVSPFTKENGYELAGSYENGQTVQSYGGGICQVSTSLYNAIIRAELKVTERHPHSMTVAYVPRSADAAIAGTYKDLKFENQNDFPIYIEGNANGSTITFTVYGVKEDPDRTVEFESETTSVKQSSGEKTIQDPTLAEGTKILEQSGHTGYTARLWKIVKVNGKETERTVFNNSTYMATSPTYRVGTKKQEATTAKEDKNKDKTTQKATTAAPKTTQKTTAAAPKTTQKATTAAPKTTEKASKDTAGTNQ